MSRDPAQGRRTGAEASGAARGTVRALDGRDLPQVAQLYAANFPVHTGQAQGRLLARLERVFLRNPWRDERLPSLVYAEPDGGIVGCLGVLPRPMSVDGRRLLAAVSHSFIVAPGSRGSLAALQLVQRFIAGPQDLSLAEGSEASRRIWERAGGISSLLYSLRWTRPLRPCRYVLSFLRKRGLPTAAGWLLEPMCRLGDALAPALAPRLFDERGTAAVHGEPLDAAKLSFALPQFTRDRALRPEYSPDAAAWLVETLEDCTERGPLQRVLVHSAAGEMLGWYLYFPNRSGIADVLQVTATPQSAGAVLEHLFRHARAQGSIAVSGQLDPPLFKALADRHCVFHHDGRSWLLAMSRRPEVIAAIRDGDAVLSRLEGEWWIGATLGQAWPAA